MNDIERYHFWNSEMENHIKKTKEENPSIDLVKRLDEFGKENNISDIKDNEKGA